VKDVVRVIVGQVSDEERGHPPAPFPNGMEKEPLPGFATLGSPDLGEGELPLERSEGGKWGVPGEAFGQDGVSSSMHLNGFLRLYLGEAGAHRRSQSRPGVLALKDLLE
jgi:hypothetical protein